MKRLIVLRHAKSAWDTAAPDDHARPLSKRGKRDAPRIGAELARLGYCPSLVLSSTAKRARDTWKRMKGALPDAEEIRTRDLYMADLSDVRRVVTELGEAHESVAVVGHNPGWEDLVSELYGRETLMTTANAAVLRSEADSWKQAFASGATWELETLLRPKELPDAKDSEQKANPDS